MSILLSILLFFLGIAIGSMLFIKKYISISKDLATKKQKIEDLTETSKNQEKLNSSLAMQFENIASKVLEEKNTKIIDLNKLSLETIVSPFKTKIDEFKIKVDSLQVYEAEKMSSLQKELEKLVALNNKLSKEANNLADALKGDSKLQGIWGELTLERIFEYVGMIEGVNYLSQKQFKDTANTKIPDYIVKLPEDKHIIIDAKTSLLAYEKYYNTQNGMDKKTYLKEHSTSIKKHIDELASKDYASLTDINQPEYVLMFVPIENAIPLALQDKPDLVSYAFKKNIAIVTPSTLLATLKTVEYIWRQEYQKKNVIEIAKQGGNLYDKFVTFTQTLLEADKKISEAKNKIEESLKRLSSSDKKGDSLIDRVQKLKELGASTKKEIPHELLKQPPEQQ
ncbi:MAG: DNA recombination protein RmuC [Endomicrobium sp.]|jgi:DNA recombination protein RmuC|nr:DNA recombination protein RmuC [Endomicrobium sp.]